MSQPVLSADQRIHADSVNTGMNGIVGRETNYGTVFVTPFIGVVRFGYNATVFFRAPPEGISRKDNIISGVRQMGRGLLEIIPIFGAIGSSVLNDNKFAKLKIQRIDQATQLVVKGEIAPALQTIMQGIESHEAAMVLWSVHRKVINEANGDNEPKMKEDKCSKLADLYLSFSQYQNLRIIPYLELKPIVELVKDLIASPETLEKAKKLALIIREWAIKIEQQYSLDKPEQKPLKLANEAKDCIEKHELMLQKYRIAST